MHFLDSHFRGNDMFFDLLLFRVIPAQAGIQGEFESTGGFWI